MQMDLRACKSGDTAAICSIYNHYVLNTVISFEERPLSMPEMAARIASFTQQYPWLVCEVEGDIAGFAYAAKWKDRSAYRRTAEATVYLRPGFARKGYGKALYGRLLSELDALGCHVVLGCIALPNEASVALHEYFGFRKVAHFNEVGRKFGRWLDVGYWQRNLGG